MLTRTDPLYSATTEDLQALLRPLFITSFLIADFLADNDFLALVKVATTRKSVMFWCSDQLPGRFERILSSFYGPSPIDTALSSSSFNSILLTARLTATISA